jgi:hypothetical protein
LRFITPGQLASYNAAQLARLNLVKVENPDLLREPQIEVLMHEIQLRVLAPAPLLPCDDADGWKESFKHLQTLRRDYIKAQRAISVKLLKAKRAGAAKSLQTSGFRNVRTSVEVERDIAETTGAAKLGQMLRSLQI